jgi:hypothetical protein
MSWFKCLTYIKIILIIITYLLFKYINRHLNSFFLPSYDK